MRSMTNHHGWPRLPECQSASPFQKILHTVVIIIAVWVGMKLGELKAICEGAGHGGWSHFQGY